MIGHRFGRERKDIVPAAVLLLACFLGSLGDLRAELLPSLEWGGLPPMERQAMQYALLAIAASLPSLVRRAQWPSRRQLGDAVLIGLGLFVAPALLIHFSLEWVTDMTRVALFSLVPVFAVVFEPYTGRDELLAHKDGLMAGLVALLGTLCLFPLDVPHTLEAGSAFCAVIVAAACVAAANCRAVAVAQEAPGMPTAPMAAIAGASAALAFAATSAVTEHVTLNWWKPGPELAWISAVGLPELLLLFWLMRRMSAARMTTRFVLAPLLANLIVLVLLRPRVSLRATLGLLLIAGGSGWMLLANDEAPKDDSLPLKLDRS